ncbi:MAG TPA: peptidoglycan DD-metalloendopeptidase family protein [Xanthomonadaceae bacterium]|jgi:lipoprotein NlpD|nr:peptidoglycan DD-metalloendopeptidase family protein [Xanthomonadaceae bacterium]
MNPVAQSAHCLRWLALAVLVGLLGACGEAHVVSRAPDEGATTHAAPVPAPRHAAAGEVEVVRGDTLYGIAFRNGMDFRELAAMNSIQPPYTIYVGQILKLHGERARAPIPARAIVQSPPHPQRTPSQPNAAQTPSPSPSATTATRTDTGASAPSLPTPFETVPAPASTATTTAPAPAQVASSPVHPLPAVVIAPSPSTVHAAPAPAPVADDTARTPSAAILPADVATVAVGGVHWHWPVKGSLIERFAAGDATRQGIDIAGNAGEPVLAASDGVVVYSGSGLVGYGELIIIKHSDEWLSAYGHNRKRLVAEGQRVKAGQPIAEMGSTGAPRDELHFEIRRNGRPVDPLQYLPEH